MDEGRKKTISGKNIIFATGSRPRAFTGIGTPEPLKNPGSDVWSRRITQEDRPVHRVADDFIDVLQARYHYWIHPTGSWCSGRTAVGARTGRVPEWR